MARIGIFGGSFNPPHFGHLNSVQIVQKKLGLDRVIVVPTYKNPLRSPVEGPSPEERLEMTKLAFADLGDVFMVSDTEIKRKGDSYSVDTIRKLATKFKDDELYFILGADAFHDFDQWKNPEDILDLANLVVTSRPGFELPADAEELPKAVRTKLAEFDFNIAELTSEKSVQFITLTDVNISATELRKSLRVGRKVDKFLPLSVENYIKEHKLYQPLGDRIGDYGKFASFCAAVLFGRKAIRVKGFDLRKMSAPSEFTLIASGTSTKHASSLAENVLRAVKEEYNVFPQSIEGLDEGRWVVLDYGSLIVHVFYDFVRQEYSLENLWSQGIDMKFEDPTPVK